MSHLSKSSSGRPVCPTDKSGAKVDPLVRHYYRASISTKAENAYLLRSNDNGVYDKEMILSNAVGEVWLILVILF